MIHLLNTNGSIACGATGDASSDINHVECKACEARHARAEFLASLPTALDLLGADSRADVLPAIKRDVALALKAGALPPGTKVSITKNRGGWTASYNVRIVAWAGAVFCAAYVETLMDPSVPFDRDARYQALGAHTGRSRYYIVPEYSDALIDAVQLLSTIANRHNFDRSDPMTDYFHVGYYLTCDARPVEAIARQAIEREANPELAALHERAAIAAKDLGPAVVRSYCGKQGIEGAAEWSLKRLVELHERANGRPLAYDKRMRRWQATTAAPGPGWGTEESARLHGRAA